MVVLKIIMSNSNAIYMECQNKEITSILNKHFDSSNWLAHD
jgi:hypothetical protein